MYRFDLPPISDMAENRAPGGEYERYLQDHPEIGELRQVFGAADANVYLRGSFLRRERPFDDVDLLVVRTDPDGEAAFPLHHAGVQIAYSTLTNEELDHHFDNSPRSWYGLLEPAEIRSADDSTRDIFASRQRQWLDGLIPDHMAYLVTEERNHSRRQDTVGAEGYTNAKYRPGSKHTIMRGMYLLKLLHPEGYRTYDTHAALADYRDLGLVPATLPDDVGTVYESLGSGNTFDGVWQGATGRIAGWFSDVRSEALDASVPHLPEDYAGGLETVMSDDADAGSLDVVHGYAVEQMLPHRRWTLLCALAAHPNTSADALVRIWEDAKGDQSNKTMLRFVLRHGNFPVAVVDPGDLPDSMSMKIWKARQEAAEQPAVEQQLAA
jgi:hypothetical protein